MTTRRVLSLTVLAGNLIALWAAPPAAPPTSEREEFLFLLSPPPQPAGAKATGTAAQTSAVLVMWIPAPVLKYCLGKTHDQCAAIDYCIRTTNRDVSQCRNLTVDVAGIPKYPPGIYPRRVLSVTYFRVTPTNPIPGLSDLVAYFDARPKADFNRISMKARFKAKIRVKRSADDDDFDLLAVLAMPGS